jgi:hypothetical protein
LKSGFLIRLLRLDPWRRRKERKFLAQGDHDCWPFLNQAEMERARARPRLLNGPPNRQA